ncbi:DJ-1/PfpI family protein [Bosea sp. SSUT16]|uniref:DJ-1/PfpI family protein n=1 Tax=Bosea spartocytisi TaxID=2773451 RepID=A0A927EEV3_9HYPH|nr:DJ-1/PfpI family protein [Bosea spartocytisi]MBD3848855.1 DJ-1/PfpI family protein [Bosea spartocytisi]
MTEKADVHRTSRRSVMAAMGLSAAMLALPRASHAAPATSRSSNTQEGEQMILGMLIFDGFQLLDVFGPLEMFGDMRDQVRIVMLAERQGPIASSAGPQVMVDATIASAPKLDILMIPGGGGTRREVNNTALIDVLRSVAEATPHVASICTGAALLARTGLLDGVRATTNKRAFKWASSQGQNVQWVRQARWIEDGKYFTSSGISAGTDMALALIVKLYGPERAQEVANGAEYRWNRDSLDDPFAKLNGLIE